VRDSVARIMLYGSGELLQLSVLQTVVRCQNAGFKLLSTGASLLQVSGISAAAPGQSNVMLLAIQEVPEWLRPRSASCLRPIDKRASSDNKRNGELDSSDETEAEAEVVGSAPR
jgi:hypothetical protein